VFIALKAWLQYVLGLDNLHVVRHLVNRVPTPTPPFALMSHISQTRLATNIPTLSPLAHIPQIALTEDIDFCIQVDCFGEDSGGMAMAISTAFRSGEAVEFLKAYNVAPLWADPATEIQFVNGEEQYEERWTTRLHLEYKPSISFSLPFFNSATISIMRADP
jgi:hypothetical protein